MLPGLFSWIAIKQTTGSPRPARANINVEQAAAIVLVAAHRAVALQVGVGSAMIGVHAKINSTARQML